MLTTVVIREILPSKLSDKCKQSIGFHKISCRALIEILDQLLNILLARHSGI